VETITLPKGILLEIETESQLPTEPDIVEELYQVRVGFFAPRGEWHVQLHSVPDEKTIQFVSTSLGRVLKDLRKAVERHQAELEGLLKPTDSNIIIIPNGQI